MLAQAETLGQALGKKWKYVLPRRPATTKWAAWPTALPPLLSKTTSGAFQCRLPAPFPLVAYILSGPPLSSRVSGVTSAFRLQTRRNVVRGCWRQHEGAGLSPSRSNETRPSKIRGVAKGKLHFPGDRGSRLDNSGVACELSREGEGLGSYLPGLGSLGVTDGLSGPKRRDLSSWTDRSRAVGFGYQYLGAREIAQAHTAPTSPLSWIHITHHILAHGVCSSPQIHACRV